MDFPQYADLVKLLSNPVTFGILVSLIWEQTALFRDDKISPAVKFVAVTLTGLAWALLVSVMKAGALPQGLPEWYGVLMLGIATVASSQVFHKLVNAYLPALGDLLVQLRIGQSPVGVSVTTGGTVAPAVTVKTEQLPIPLSAEPLKPAEPGQQG